MIRAKKGYKIKNLEGRCRRGVVTASRENSFQIRISGREMVSFYKKESEIYKKPLNKANILCIYSGKLKEEVERIIGLTGEVYYLKKS